MKHLDHSPIDNSRLAPYLSCKDHSITGESFDLFMDSANDLLVTNPLPQGELISKYYESDQYISHTDRKSSALDRVYQWVRSYTLKRKLTLINSFQTKERSLLDVGAGTGDFLKVCKQDNWKTVGVEPNQGARAIAEQKLGISLFEDLSSVGQVHFDVISLWHVLEHVPDLNKTMTQLCALLKPKGRLLIAVPNYKSHDAMHYGKFWAAYDVPRHCWHFSQSSMHALCQKFGLEVEQILPMKFDAYYVSLLSEKYRSGKLNPFRAFLTGFVSNFKARRSSEYSSLIYVVKNGK